MCVVDKQRYTHTLKHEQHIKIAISREFLEFLKIATKVEYINAKNKKKKNGMIKKNAQQGPKRAFYRSNAEEKWYMTKEGRKPRNLIAWHSPNESKNKTKKNALYDEVTHNAIRIASVWTCLT